MKTFFLFCYDKIGNGQKAGKVRNLILILLCHTICACSVLDRMNSPSFKEYEYNIKNILGYGPVNHWASQDFEKWLDAQVRNNVNWVTIEFFCWNSPQEDRSHYYENPDNLKKPYQKLVKECRKRNIVLMVSIVNDNKGSGKYGDDKKGLAYYKSQIRRGREIVLEEGPEGVVIQPVAETQTNEGQTFESETIDLAHQKGFKTCWNNNSRPTNSNGCTYFAYHPSSTSDIGVEGGIIVVDHGQILRELSKNGKDVFGPYDPVKISSYAAKVHAGQRGFVHYGFGDDQVDFDIIKALGSITKK